MQGWTATIRHTKRNTKRLKHTGNLFIKNLQIKDVCYFSKHYPLTVTPKISVMLFCIKLIALLRSTFNMPKITHVFMYNICLERIIFSEEYWKLFWSLLPTSSCKRASSRLPLASNFQNIFIYSRASILESKGMCVIFQKKDKKGQINVKKRATYLKMWGKYTKFENVLKKGRWLRAIMAHNKLLEKALYRLYALDFDWSKCLCIKVWLLFSNSFPIFIISYLLWGCLC